jgi:hypothetical protein
MYVTPRLTRDRTRDHPSLCILARGRPRRRLLLPRSSTHAQVSAEVQPRAGTFEMTTESIRMGALGLSSLVGTLEMATHSSSPDVILPNTGWRLAPSLNQSRPSLSLTLMKNCEPPESGAPVLAIDSVPSSLESSLVNSSLMLPPLKRLSVAPDARLVKAPSGGLPVPALRSRGSFDKPWDLQRVEQRESRSRIRLRE